MSAREAAIEALGLDSPRGAYRLMKADPEFRACAFRPYGGERGVWRFYRKAVEAWVRRKARAGERRTA